MGSQAKPENGLQYACIEFMWVAALPDVLYCHVPNEGERSKGQRIHMWKMGLLPGFPDLQFFRNGKAYFIELKMPGKSLSDDQWKVRRRLEAAGFDCAVCRTLEDFIETVTGWGLVKGNS